MIENQILRRTSLSKKGGGNMHNEKLQNLYASPKIIKVGKMDVGR